MILPKYYEFFNRVKTISGHKALEQIPKALLNLNATRPIIITDKGISGAGLIKLITNAIGESKIKIGAVYDNVPPDSEVTVINELSIMYKSNSCDSIIGIGGGSVIDTCKGLNILVSENSNDLMKFTGYNAITKPLKPFIVIPTTGSGSEVTMVAVIADHVKNLKMLFPSIFLLPNYAILDPRMTKTLPPFITASSGMDALTHAIEAYIDIQKNPLSDAHAINAVTLISRNILNVVKNPDDLQSRLDMANASLLAGAAFSNSMVGMVHTLGHSVGAVCHTPHGICMSILLPYTLEYNMHRVRDYIADLLFPLAGPEIFASTNKKDRAEKVIEYIRQLNQDLHNATNGRHALRLKDVKDKDGNMQVPKNTFPEIAQRALGDGSILNNPEELDYDDCIMVLEHAWEGIPLDRKKIKKG